MSHTTSEMIADWFDNGVKRCARYMLVICDTFSYDDYPSYAMDDRECWEKYNSAVAGENMQRLMEVYDLSLPKEVQLDPRKRAMNMPPRLVTK